MAHPEFAWNWNLAELNTSLTLDDILHNPKIHYNWDECGYYPGITIEDMLKYREQRWNMYSLSWHRYYTLDKTETMSCRRSVARCNTVKRELITRVLRGVAS